MDISQQLTAFARRAARRRGERNIFSRWRSWWQDLSSDDRGDVPGWVLITLMTAGLVVIIWGFAGPALQELFERAMDSVSAI